MVSLYFFSKKWECIVYVFSSSYSVEYFSNLSLGEKKIPYIYMIFIIFYYIVYFCLRLLIIVHDKLSLDFRIDLGGWYISINK